jgi:hypothetical protein
MALGIELEQDKGPERALAPDATQAQALVLDAKNACGDEQEPELVEQSGNGGGQGLEQAPAEP